MAIKGEKNKMVGGGEENVKDKFFFPGEGETAGMTIEANSREEAEERYRELVKDKGKKVVGETKSEE
jgi:hypothetical protein